MNGNEISTVDITCGARTYFFDINKTIKGDLYLKISESRKFGGSFVHHRLMIFEEDIDVFADALQRSLLQFKIHKAKKKAREKSASEKNPIKRKLPVPAWNPDDDLQLETLFAGGKRSSELALLFKIDRDAVNSRIKRLGLREKYRNRGVKQDQIRET